MIKIENVQICGWEPTIRGMRNPLNSWVKSDSEWTYITPENEKKCTLVEEFDDSEFWVGPNDKGLMERLAKGGPAHAKYRRFITVYLDIVAPLYWWKEFETYKVGTDSNSCSTMHKLTDKEFTLEDFSTDHLIDYERYSCNEKEGLVLECAPHIYCGGVQHMHLTINVLNFYRNQYLIAAKKLKRTDLTEAERKHTATQQKLYWWQMIQLLPSSYNQRRTIKLNYETLYRIYHDRKGHKLDEWNEFCAWIESLPLSEVITGAKIEEKEDSPWISCTDENAKMPEEGDEVLCTLRLEWPHGNSTDIRHFVFEGEYKLAKENYYDMPAANGKGYFEANNDWDEGQSLAVIAWMPKPKAYKE